MKNIFAMQFAQAVKHVLAEAQKRRKPGNQQREN